ncbi:nucleotidyltransferase family protein [Shewanella sp. VB17]|uniref:nucleotidyltransferase family protein n=1 Tax=Shewanella sp. VB17 TaxID=2739432 RepID=UPI002814DD78|nr:nucleotidyltransferase family protein [Shewanella sp. VB17]
MSYYGNDEQTLVSNEALLIAWIRQDPVRMRALSLVNSLNLPQGMIAAGFVRNLVWDRLHKMTSCTPLNDIDVIYFESTDLSTETDKLYELKLRELAPDLLWSVKNQARMHMRNGDKPYHSSLDAMSYWPEQETAIGVSLAFAEENELQLVSAFGLESLFNLQLTPNPKRLRAVFEARLSKKAWLRDYPKLNVDE